MCFWVCVCVCGGRGRLFTYRRQSNDSHPLLPDQYRLVDVTILKQLSC
jgi:hypothetical protein